MNASPGQMDSNPVAVVFVIVIGVWLLAAGIAAGLGWWARRRAEARANAMLERMRNVQAAWATRPSTPPAPVERRTRTVEPRMGLGQPSGTNGPDPLTLAWSEPEDPIRSVMTSKADSYGPAPVWSEPAPDQPKE